MLLKVTLPDAAVAKLDALCTARLVARRVVLTDLILAASQEAEAKAQPAKPRGRPRAKDDITWWLKDATGYTAEKRPHKKIPQQCLDGEWYAQNAFGPAGVFKDVTWTPVYPAGYPEELKGFDHIKVARAFRETGEVILDDSTR